MIEHFNFFKLNDLEEAVKKILLERYNYAIIEFEKTLTQYKYRIIIGDELKRLYIINDKYVVFVGVMYYPYNMFDEDKYNNKTDDYYLNSRFLILFDEVVWDNDLKIDFNVTLNLFAKKYSSPMITYYETYQYFERIFKDGISFKFDDNDKFFTIAEYFKEKINLYNFLEKNQNAQNIEDNRDFEELVSYYEGICLLFEREIENYKYKKYGINRYESVYLLEDSLVIYVGAKGSNSLFRDKNKQNGNVIDRYSIVFQELTYNNLYKNRNFSKFIKNIKIMESSLTVSNNFNNLYYRPFTIGNSEETIVKGYKLKFYNKSNFEYVNKKLPEIELQKRFDEWKGELRNYIVYEFIYYKNKKGYAVASTLDSNPRMSARTILRQYEKNAGYLMYYSGITYDSTWGELLSKFVEEQKKLNWSGYKRIGEQSSIMAEKVQYFIIPFYVNNKNVHTDIIAKIIQDAKEGKYDNLERTLYDISEYKWKSEELMYECVKKVFKNRKVIHQYRPYFLGQQSYDVYVCGENIAFEYQGKQHFEPIDIFGGVEGFEENKKRDAKKAEISKKNGIKLIYINYWEDVTVDLIKEKLKNIIKIY